MYFPSSSGLTTRFDVCAYFQEFLNSLDNLPAEIQHLFSEFKDKEKTFVEINLDITQKQKSLRKYARTPSSAANQELKLQDSIKLKYEQAIKLSEEKVALSQKIIDLIDRHIKRMDFDLRKVKPDWSTLIQSSLAQFQPNDVSEPYFSSTGLATPSHVSLLPSSLGPTTSTHFPPSSSSSSSSSSFSFSSSSSSSHPLTQIQPSQTTRHEMTDDPSLIKQTRKHRRSSTADINSTFPSSPFLPTQSTSHLPTVSPTTATSTSLTFSSTSRVRKKRLSVHRDKDVKDFTPTRGSPPSSTLLTTAAASSTTSSSSTSSSSSSTSSTHSQISSFSVHSSTTLSHPDTSNNYHERPLTSTSHQLLVPHEEEEEASDDTPYCYCRQPSYGQMIGCDNVSCQVEWFHYECVGLTEPPPESWFCKDCKVKMEE